MKFYIPLAATLAFSLCTASGVPAQTERAAADTAYTLDTIVVTATRTGTPLKEVGSSISVVTKQDIERKQKETVFETLRGMPGLDAVQTGGPGKTASVFLRGADADYTLVLIDGVEMNDPIATGRSYDFANLTVDHVERIEILRGPQSTLYGSDAMGGVINIITQRGEGRPRLSLSTQSGSLRTVRGQAGLSGGNAISHYALGFSWWRTDGVSAASSTLGNTEKDGYRNASLSGKFGFTPHERFDVDFMVRYIDATADIDNGGGAFADDPNRVQDTRQAFLRTQGRLRLWDRRWLQTFGYSFSDHAREDLNDADPAHPNDTLESTFDSRLHRFDWQNTLHLHEVTTLVFGVETEEEQGASTFRSESAFGPFESIFAEQTARTTGYYLQDQIHYRDAFFGAFGFRIDDHTLFGAEATFRLTPAVFIARTGTRLKGSYGTGFKAPSLFQLYSSFGAPSLRPGESTGWDAGVEQYGWQRRVSTGVTYFHTDFTNLIDFDSGTSSYKNILRAASQGVEWFGRVEPHRRVLLQANYTYTDTEDKTTGLPLLRRPRHKWGIDAGYGVSAKAQVSLGVIVTGQRDDLDFSTFPATRVTLDGYTLVNLTASYDIARSVRVFGRIDNLLDRDYEEVFGFGTPGITTYAGVKLGL